MDHVVRLYEVTLLVMKQTHAAQFREIEILGNYLLYGPTPVRHVIIVVLDHP